MPTMATAGMAGVSLLGSAISSRKSGPEAGASQAAGMSSEFAQGLYDLYMSAYPETLRMEQDQARQTIPLAGEATRAGIEADLRDRARFDQYAPGLEAKLMAGIEEGATDRTGARMEEAMGDVSNAYDRARGILDRSNQRLHGLGIGAGTGRSRNENLQLRVAEAGDRAGQSRQARETEIARLDAAKIAYPQAGLNAMRPNQDISPRNITGYAPAVTPGSITGAGQAASGAYQNLASAERKGIGGLAQSVGGIDWGGAASTASPALGWTDNQGYGIG